MLPFIYLVDATACRSPHHRMALDALLLLTCRHTKRWQRMLLKHYEDFLDGAKAPDSRFKDFRNHVLHVNQDNWGGAPDSAIEWYETTVEAARQQAWKNVAFSAGVMSHYITDAIHPFHTGQSEAETNIHRAFEWSTSKSYRRMRSVSDVLQESPAFDLAEGEEWLHDSIVDGARYANQFYEPFIKQYDFNLGSWRPVAALDNYCTKSLTELIRYATRFFAKVLSRALDEVDIMPPMVNLHAEAIIATSKTPFRWVLRGIDDAKARIEVGRMHDEFERTGKVSNQMPEECRAIKSMLRQEFPTEQAPNRTRPETAIGMNPDSNFRVYGEEASVDEITFPEEANADSARQVERQSTTPTSRVQLKAKRKRNRSSWETERTPKMRRTDLNRKPASQAGEISQQDAAGLEDYDAAQASGRGEASNISSDTGDANGQRYFLALPNPVVDAPSIGPKTAKRLAKCDVHTVADLLSAQPAMLSSKLGTTWITRELIGQWQQQATLVCRIPGLRGHDSQLLVACDYPTVDAVAGANVNDLLQKVVAFCKTPDGQRIVRSGKRPDYQEVNGWIESAAEARQLTEAA